jgi:hypothetical protein
MGQVVGTDGGSIIYDRCGNKAWPARIADNINAVCVDNMGCATSEKWGLLQG